MTTTTTKTIVKCDNCGTAMGRLEEAYVWLDHPVCEGCYERLKARQQSQNALWKWLAIGGGIAAILLVGVVVFLLLREPRAADASSGSSISPGAPAATGSAPASKSRPASVTRFNGHAYQMFNEELTWHEAQRRCAEMGGYLVCVTSKEEDEFVRKLSNNENVWLGLTDEQVEGTWRWVSGEPFAFANWAGQGADNSSGAQHNVHYWVGRGWDDAYAGLRIRFICEWDR